jgi:uncharacterized protein (TIGR02271 family)
MFDDRAAALRARDRLLAAGVDDADLILHDAGGTPSGTTTTASSLHDEPVGIAAWFRSLFGMDDTDERVAVHTEASRRGATMLSVDARDDTLADRAAAILEECGAIDLDTRSAQWRSEGWAGTTRVASAGTTETPRRASADDATQRTIPVVEERLAVAKRTVERGGVRVYSRVVERPVEEQVRLREEHAEVHRRRVDRPATEADVAAAMDGATIELRETVEEPVVSKRAHVVEEIDVGRQVTERTETVRDTVRRTEVDVDPIGATEREHAMARRETGSAPGRDASSDPVSGREAGGRRD